MGKRGGGGEGTPIYLMGVLLGNFQKKNLKGRFGFQNWTPKTERAYVKGIPYKKTDVQYSTTTVPSKVV